MKLITKSFCKNCMTFHALLSLFFMVAGPCYNGGAEIASIGKCKYGKCKYKVGQYVRMENTSTENASMNLQGWNTQVRKT